MPFVTQYAGLPEAHGRALFNADGPVGVEKQGKATCLRDTIPRPNHDHGWPLFKLQTCNDKKPPVNGISVIVVKGYKEPMMTAQSMLSAWVQRRSCMFLPRVESQERSLVIERKPKSRSAVITVLDR